MFNAHFADFYLDVIEFILNLLNFFLDLNDLIDLIDLNERKKSGKLACFLLTEKNLD